MRLLDGDQFLAHHRHHIAVEQGGELRVVFHQLSDRPPVYRPSCHLGFGPHRSRLRFEFIKQIIR